jgi:hypothetical protein
MAGDKMNMSKKLILTALCAVLILLVSGYAITAFAADADDEVKVRSLEMFTDTATVRVNQERILMVEIFPINAADQNIYWESSNPEVALVDGDGVVTGISPGTAIITAVSGNGRTAECTVTVPGTVLTGIELDVKNRDHPLASVDGGERLSAATLRIDAEAAAKQTKSGAITLTYTGKTTVSTTALRAAAFTAASAGKTANLRFRTLDDNGKIQGQLTISAEDAGDDDRDLNLTVLASGERVEEAAKQAGQYFGSPAAAVILGQSGEFGMTVHVAAKADMTGFDKTTPRLYRKNGAKYTLLDEQEVGFDENGYIYFTATAGGTYLLIQK